MDRNNLIEENHAFEPWASVIVLAYNRRTYIREAIESLLSQSADTMEFEVIVVKNFEDDLIDRYPSIMENFKVIDSPDGTLGEYICKGIDASTGRLISFLDDDDLFASTKISSLKNIFAHKSNLGLVHNTVYTFNDKNVSSLKLLGVEKSTERQCAEISQNSNKRMLNRIIQNGMSFNLSSITVKRELLMERYSDIKQIITDPDLTILLLCLDSNYEALHCEQKLTFYRVSQSTSRPLLFINGQVEFNIDYLSHSFNGNKVILDLLQHDELKAVIKRNLTKLNGILTLSKTIHDFKKHPILSFLLVVISDRDNYYLKLFFIGFLLRIPQFKRLISTSKYFRDKLKVN